MFARIIEEQNRINQVNYLASWGLAHNKTSVRDLKKEAEANFGISPNTAYNRARRAQRQIEKLYAQAQLLGYVIGEVRKAWQNWQNQQRQEIAW